MGQEVPVRLKLMAALLTEDLGIALLMSHPIGDHQATAIPLAPILVMEIHLMNFLYTTTWITHQRLVNTYLALIKKVG
jgi:hypothetical protein